MRLDAHQETLLFVLMQELLEYTVRSVDSIPTDKSEDGCSSAGEEDAWGDNLACADTACTSAPVCVATLGFTGTGDTACAVQEL